MRAHSGAGPIHPADALVRETNLLTFEHTRRRWRAADSRQRHVLFAMLAEVVPEASRARLLAELARLA